MDSNIVKFNPKNAALDPDVVLEHAKTEFDKVFVIGWNKNSGELDARASLNLTQSEILWLISVFQHKLLNGDYSGD